MYYLPYGTSPEIFPGGRRSQSKGNFWRGSWWSKNSENLPPRAGVGHFLEQQLHILRATIYKMCYLCNTMHIHTFLVFHQVVPL